MSRIAASRAIARISWRDIRRNRWRSALIATLIALPITGLTGGAIVVATITPSAQERATGELGEADFRISSWDDSLSVEQIVSLFPQGTRSVLVHTWIARTVVGGSYQSTSIFDADPADPVVGSMLALIEGRAPETTSEIAVSPRVLDGFDAQIGGSIAIGDEERTYRIVGIAVAPEQLNRPIGIVVPGSLSSNAEAGLSGLFLAFPPDAAQGTWRDVVYDQDTAIRGYMPREGFLNEGDSGLAFFGASLGITALILLETGLIVAAAFVVGARRQLRTIGLVGAAGGEPRHVKRLVLSAGAILGSFGSVVGIGAGIAIAVALSPQFDRIAGRITGPLSVPFAVLIGGLVLGTVAATLAALQPARTAARVQTVDALAGRSPSPRPAGRLVRLGLVAVAMGAVAVGWGTSQDNEIVLGVGLIAVVGGFLLTIPALVTRLGRIATRFPLPMRIAARDTARHGRRTAAAVAAAAVALIIPVAVATLTLSNEASDRARPLLADDHLVIQSGSIDSPSFAANAAALASEITDEVLEGAVVASFAMAVYDQGTTEQSGFSGPDFSPGFVRGEIRQRPNGDEYIEAELISIGDNELLRAMHTESAIADLEDGVAVVFNENVLVGATTLLESPPVDIESPPANDQSPFEETSIPASDASTDAFKPGRLPGVVISKSRAAELGLTPSEDRTFLLRATEPISQAQITAAKDLAANYPGMYVSGVQDTVFNAAPLRDGALGFSTAVALGIVAVAVALVAAESRRDQAILTAVGAGPWTRRKVIGSSALLLTLIAALVAVPAGFIPASIVQATSDQGYPFVIPWLTIIGVVVAVPLTAGLIAAAVSRRPPAAQLLRPIS